MPLKTSEKVRLSIECPECSQLTEKALAWLVTMDNLPCAGCGFSIDLKSGDAGALIKKFDDICTQLDRPARELR